MIQDGHTSRDLADAIERVVEDFEPTLEEFRYVTKAR